MKKQKWEDHSINIDTNPHSHSKLAIVCKHVFKRSGELQVVTLIEHKPTDSRDSGKTYVCNKCIKYVGNSIDEFVTLCIECAKDVTREVKKSIKTLKELEDSGIVQKLN